MSIYRSKGTEDHFPLCLFCSFLFKKRKALLDSIDTVIPCASAVMYKHPSWRNVTCKNHPCVFWCALSLLLRRQQGSIEVGWCSPNNCRCWFEMILVIESKRYGWSERNHSQDFVYSEALSHSHYRLLGPSQGPCSHTNSLNQSLQQNDTLTTGSKLRHELHKTYYFERPKILASESKM